jgi:hypothetical protein
MRVGLKRNDTSRRRAAHASRALKKRVESALPPQVELGPVWEPVTQSEPVVAGERELSAEWRLRASGGPDDRAHYHCACGYAFEASVSTSVRCPHCGSGQAW